MNQPITKVPITEITVNSIPSLPEARAECRFIPNPSPTTEYCNKYLDVFLLNFGCACPQVNAKISPRNKATGGVTHADHASNPEYSLKTERKSK